MYIRLDGPEHLLVKTVQGADERSLTAADHGQAEPSSQKCDDGIETHVIPLFSNATGAP